MTETIGWAEFLVVFACSALTILACRVAPLFLLKGRSLPEPVERALECIPAAAFAALVANDLFAPDLFSAGVWPAAVPLLAALVVVVVARATKSLLWCALAGVAAYALLSLL